MTKVYALSSYGEIEDQESASITFLYPNKKEGLVYQTAETIITPVTSPEFWTRTSTINTKTKVTLEASFTPISTTLELPKTHTNGNSLPPLNWPDHQMLS